MYMHMVKELEKMQRDKRQLKLANVFPRRNHMEKKKR
jgi:hypothetical protein